MCELQKKNMISCQLSYYPIATLEYKVAIDKVIKIIEDSGINYEVSGTGTVILGESEKVFLVLEKIVSQMKENKFVLNISVSNICGCEEV